MSGGRYTDTPVSLAVDNGQCDLLNCLDIGLKVVFKLITKILVSFYNTLEKDIQSMS